jgi:PAS domain S-box-containing protein
MICDVLDGPEYLAHQRKPGLVLNSSGTVVAANEGSIRLIFAPQIATSNDVSLIGKNIVDLGLVLLPGVLPVLWTWKDILDAASDLRNLVDSVWQNKTDRPQYIPTTNVYKDSHYFWNREDEYQSIVESDVYVTRHVSGDSTREATRSTILASMLRVRATVHWYPSSKGGCFLITFSRRSLPQKLAPTSSTPVTDPVDSPQKTTNGQSHSICYSPPKSFDTTSSNLSTDVEEMMSGPSGIASSILPYIMAVLDSNGQAIGFSKSWYRLSGLDESESLGSGWLTIMHPDDVVEMTIAWIDAIRNQRSHWTYQARYRTASDGTYCWFLIRAQPLMDALGNVLRWYASMVDIDQLVVARLQVGRRQQSILTLFSQTDVMLWEIDKTNRMYICEGQLNWDPSRIVGLLMHNLEGQTAHMDDWKGDTDYQTDDKLVRTIRTVLQGRAFNPVVEHWEGDRYFRTRFVAERGPISEGLRKEEHGIVEAAVALTFDITEEKARSTLQKENKRLITNEQTALEATKLKSRFLANVSAQPQRIKVD